MAGMTLEAELYVLDEDYFKEVVAQFMLSEMKRGVRAFLQACLPKIPIRTGFLRGAFRKILEKYSTSTSEVGSSINKAFKAAYKEIEKVKKKEKAAGISAKIRRSAFYLPAAKNIRLSERPTIKQRNKALIKRGQRPIAKGGEYYDDGVNKVRKTPTSGIKYATPADKVVTQTGSTILFNLEVDISYYRIMDFVGRGRSGPWRSLDAGTAAMINSLETSATRFPQLEQILTTFKIKFDGNNTTRSRSRTLGITGFE